MLETQLCGAFLYILAAVCMWPDCGVLHSNEVKKAVICVACTAAECKLAFIHCKNF